MDDKLPEGDMGFFCEDIARAFQERGILLRNKVTGRECRTALDVWNWSSHGELFHIWEWYSALFPERVGWPDGTLHRTAIHDATAPGN